MKHHFIKIFILYTSFFYAQSLHEYFVSKAWVADKGNGTYKNPILHSDYSDPDVIRVGEDYYLTASSFNCTPGLPILHSKDLVNWRLINYALKKQPPFDVYDKVQHGKGVWAPCIRYHENMFYIFYPDPDYGIYMIQTENPYEDWSKPILVKEGKGLIDPSPFWDDNGKIYMVYAFAGSRAGLKSILAICTINSDVTQANNDDILLIDGHNDESTIEGPKLHKRNGYYYIFAPAGGVSSGWQTVLRAKNIYGPYEKKKVMVQGNTSINGPHQGAWVQTQFGEDWFFHFQDKGAYGRVVHLQPLIWKDNWPIIGSDEDKDGIGVPVSVYKKPKIGTQFSIETPLDSDEFNEPKLGLQWQWHANPQVYWGFPTSMGYFKMFCRPKPENDKNIYNVNNLLLQKFPSDTFKATTKMTFNPLFDGEKVGLLVMGLDYSYIKIEQENGKLFISQVICKNADMNTEEIEIDKIEIKSRIIYLQADIKVGAIVNFSYSLDGKQYKNLGNEFTARAGKWIGAKIGFFALKNEKKNDAGSVDIDWFRVN